MSLARSMEKEVCLGRDLEQCKGQLRSNNPLMPFAAPSWAGVLKVEVDTGLEETA